MSVDELADLRARLAASEAARASSDERAANLEAARASSEERAANLEAARASEAERAAILAAQLNAIQHEALPVYRLPPPIHLGVTAALAAAKSTLLVDSPSKAGSPSIQDTLAHLGMAAAPLTPALAPLTAAPSLSHWAACVRDEALREASALRPATAHVPEWIVIQPEHAPAASSLFLPRGCAAAARPRVPGATLPWNCRPELPTAVREHPARFSELRRYHKRSKSCTPENLQTL